MAKDPGSTLSTANVFAIAKTSKTVKQTLSSQDQIDIWKFNLKSKSRASLLLDGIAQNANADVLLLNSAGRVLRALRNRGNKAEKFSNVQLNAGTFYVQVQLQRGSVNTKYTLALSANSASGETADRFGNSFATATPVSVGSAIATAKDFVGNRDANDFIQFTLATPGRVNLKLTGLAADANVELYDSNRQLIAASANSNTGNENLIQRLINFGSTYYIRIAQAPGQNTAYSLSYSLTPETPITTASGLKYIDLIEGTGSVPAAGRTVLVHYTGTLENGTKFDSSRDRDRPFAFVLGAGTVIRGWDEALSTMKVGSRRQLIIPSELAYGAAGRGNIPPNATLIFDVELLGIF